MTTLRKDELVKLIAVPVAMGFRGVELTEAVTDFYFEILKDLPTGLVALAFKQYLSIGANEFFPKPGKIRDIALQIMYNQRQLTGLEAWGLMLKEISRCGQDCYLYPSAPKPIFTDPYLKEFVERIGWRQACDIPNTDFARNQFARSYEAFAKEAKEQEKLLPESRQYKALNAFTSAIEGENAKLLASEYNTE